MRAPLSIVIPTLNAETELPGTLAALMEGLQAGLVREVIFTDGGSTDATEKIAADVGALWVTGPASRGGQLARGVAEAGGPWILLLHADTHLAPGWADVVLEAIGADAPGYFQLQFRTRRWSGRWIAGWANLRARLFGLPYGDQGLLIDHARLARVGGVPDQPLMEDVALARALKGELRALPCAVQTSFARYEAAGPWRRGARNLSILLRYLAGARPEDLVQRYRR